MHDVNDSAKPPRPYVHQLANGLRVVVEDRPLAPVTAVTVRYDVGSRVERAGAKGLAHLFEHLMFQGSARVAAGEHAAAIDGVGGWFNGVTSFDDTVYYNFVPNNALELVLWLEADRMGGLLAAVDQRALDNQRDVVRNERKQMLEERPYGDALELLFAQLFPLGHPYHHLPIGSMAELKAATVDDVHGFFTEHYAPGNAVLSLVGDVREAEAISLVERYFLPIPAGKRARDVAAPSIARHDRAVVERRAPVPKPAVYLAWTVPARHDPAFGAMQLALEVLGGRHGRLVTALTRDRALAAQISAYPIALAGGNSVAIVSVHAEGATTIEQLEAATIGELERLAASIEHDELETASRALVLDQLQRDDSAHGRGTTLATSVGLFDDPLALDERLHALSQVSAAEVVRAARQWLTVSNAVLLRYLPDPDARTSRAAQGVDRSPADAADAADVADAADAAAKDDRDHDRGPDGDSA